MKNLKSIQVPFTVLEVLTREQVRKIKGGSTNQCGVYPNCLSSACTATSGPCIGRSGTCGTTSSTQTCTCAVVCQAYKLLIELLVITLILLLTKMEMGFKPNLIYIYIYIYIRLIDYDAEIAVINNTMYHKF